MAVKLKINGETVGISDSPDMPLLWFIRDRLGYTGTKFGCGVGACGACTVHVNGVAARSCITPVGDLEGTEVTTIEALAEDGQLSVLQQAWIKYQVPQCGYCQSGMLMAATALLAENPNPSEEDIKETLTNICRCGTYPRILKAIQEAATIKPAMLAENAQTAAPETVTKPETVKQKETQNG